MLEGLKQTLSSSILTNRLDSASVATAAFSLTFFPSAVAA
jgi:hypothetical protein